MVQTGQITFYTHRHSESSYCHRVHIALESAKADYTVYAIAPWDKPSWYIAQVNPLGNGKIPAITYGGPKTPADEPSPESVKLNESAIIVEFIADLFPQAGLRPADPVKLARARLFVNLFDTQFYPALGAFVTGTGDNTAVLQQLEVLQAFLPQTGFAVGQWSIADLGAGPLLVRFLMVLENEIGKYPVGVGKSTLDVIRSPRFARILKYIQDVKQQPVFQATFDEVACLEAMRKTPYLQRE